MKNNSDGSLAQHPCMSCGGRGYNNCTACGGVGYTLISKSRMRYDRTLEFYQDRVPCTGCFSSGRITCGFCKGLGWVLQSGTAPADSQVGEVPASTPANAPAGDPQASDVFKFQEYEFVRHPNHQEIWACWQHNPGNCLDIGLSIGGSTRIELTGCQTDTWLAVQDDSGSPVPLSIFVASAGGLLGKWL
jgi:hypothetical protein